MSHADVDDRRKYDANATFSCSKFFGSCFKCCHKLSKVPCCFIRLVIGLLCMGMVVAIGISIYYGVDAKTAYDKAKELIAPFAYPSQSTIPIIPNDK
jgi:hypothetical protein